MRVILMGAGASKSYDKSPTGTKMPIAKDFFPTFFKLNIANNPWVLRGAIAEYIRNERGIDNPDEYLNSGIDIEELHSEIALKLSKSSKIERFQYAKPYQELLFLFASTLNEIGNGEVSKAHLDLANFLNPEDTIITFNWDTLMERALMETKHWKVDDGYAIEPNKVFRDGWITPNLTPPTSAPKIIKLHGSVNWLTAHTVYDKEKLVLSHALPAESLFIYEHTTKPYDTHQGRYMDGYVPLTYGYYPPNLTDVPGLAAPDDRVFVRITPKYPWTPKGSSGKSGLVSMPLIIPPVKQKNYDFFGDLFTNLWQKAQQALQTCDEIIIIGYSFPQTDLQSQTLFTKAFMNRKSLPKITIIDPFPNRPAQKFRIDLGIPDTHLKVITTPFEGMKTLDLL